MATRAIANFDTKHINNAAICLPIFTLSESINLVMLSHSLSKSTGLRTDMEVDLVVVFLTVEEDVPCAPDCWGSCCCSLFDLPGSSSTLSQELPCRLIFLGFEGGTFVGLGAIVGFGAIAGFGPLGNGFFLSSWPLPLPLEPFLFSRIVYCLK